jgi:ABC-type transport system involved in multi-copper enzyme maturation permease subunit
MGFYLVFKKTLKDMLGIKRNLAFIFLGLLIPFLSLSSMWYSWTSYDYSQTPSEITQVAADSYVVLWYMWGAGILLAITVSASAAGFISKEITDGTLMLVAAKPINRWQIIAGKLVALLLNVMLLLIINHLLTVLLLRVAVGMYANTTNVLLKLTPYLLLYAFICSIFFAAVTVVFSTLMKSRVKIMMIAIFLVIAVFFSPMFMPIFGDPSFKTREIMSYFNLGRHTRLTYESIYGLAPFWEMSAGQQLVLDILSGTPTTDFLDGRTTPIHPVGSLTILLAASASAMALSVWALNRKEL